MTLCQQHSLIEKDVTFLKKKSLKHNLLPYIITLFLSVFYIILVVQREVSNEKCDFKLRPLEECMMQGEMTSKKMFLREVNIAIYRPSIGALNTECMSVDGVWLT